MIRVMSRGDVGSLRAVLGRNGRVGRGGGMRNGRRREVGRGREGERE